MKEKIIFDLRKMHNNVECRGLEIQELKVGHGDASPHWPCDIFLCQFMVHANKKSRNESPDLDFINRKAKLISVDT